MSTPMDRGYPTVKVCDYCHEAPKPCRPRWDGERVNGELVFTNECEDCHKKENS